MSMLAQELKVIGLLCVALAWCGVLLVVRTVWTHSFDYAFLVWNLGLASAPIFFSSLVVLQRRVLFRLLFGFCWLLFLPNAPYIITDFFHLRALDSGPIWLDVLLLASCAATGLALGYSSVIQIHRLFDAAGRPVLGWVVALSGMFLSGFGIYMGRVLRWRSIDLFRDPSLLFADIAQRFLNPLIHYRAWGVTLGFGIMLSLGYMIFKLKDGRTAAPHGGRDTRLGHSRAIEEPPS